MAKRSLYEILGVAADASAEDVLRAVQAGKQALANRHDEESRNQLAFLDYAREHLIDPAKRARYDATLRPAAEEAIPMTVSLEPAPSRLPSLLLVAALCAASLGAWRYTREPAPVRAEPAPIPLPVATAAPQGNDVGEGLSFEPVSAGGAPASHPAALASAQTSAQTSAQAAPPRRSYQVVSTALDAELVKKLAWSVYAVVGARGFGTGVMVDSERLLTNCHVIAGNARAGKMYAVNSITHERAEITEVAYLDHQDACLVRAPGLSGPAVSINNFAQMSSAFKTHNIGFARGTLMSSEGRFVGWAYRFGQKFLVSDNYCDHGVSGGPLVDDEGRLVGLTTGGPADKSYCLSVTAETISALKFETSRPIADFPNNYTSNVSRRS